jgi:putative ABC transport system permease protein
MIAVWEFQESLRVLAANPLRSALSILGVVFGVASVVAMLAIGMGAEKEIDSIMSSLGTNTVHFSARTLTDEEWLPIISRTVGLGDRQIGMVKELYPHAAVAAFSHWDIVEGNINLPLPWPKIIGISASDRTKIGAPVSYGRMFREYESNFSHAVILVGHSLAEALHPQHPETMLGQQIRLNRVWFEVIGIIGAKKANAGNFTANSKPEDSQNGIVDLKLEQSFLVPLKTGQMRLGPLPLLNRFDKLVVTLPTNADVIAAKNRLDLLGTISSGNTRAFDIVAAEELIEKKRATTRLFSYFLMLIATISLVVGGIGIANVMLASMVERIREVGLRRAVGATRRHILVQFVSEALAICLIGGVLGLLLGMGVAALSSAVMGWSLAFSWWGAFLSLFVSTLVGFLAGIYPARTASRISPIEALQGRV